MPHNDVLFSGDISELRVLNLGSQIIAIRKDFAQQVNVHIDLTHLLKMTGANSTINWTLRCAEFLGVQATKVSLKAQVHIIETTSSTSSLANLSKSKYCRPSMSTPHMSLPSCYFCLPTIKHQCLNTVMLQRI
jgi:hypothetical protein